MTDTTEKKSNPIARFGPLIVIALAIGAVFATGAHKYLSLNAISENYDALTGFVTENRVQAIGLFSLAYIVAVALSLPGAGILSILGGLLFGTLTGTVTVVIAATIGATIIFLVAKTALGDSLRSRAGGFVKNMEEGFQNNAFSYLLLLRLVPLFPFFIVNIVPSFLRVKTPTFFLATLIGIIPGSFAYVSVGEGAAEIIRQGGELELGGLLLNPKILTPIIALSVLAFIPIIYKAVSGRKKTADTVD